MPFHLPLSWKVELYETGGLLVLSVNYLAWAPDIIASYRGRVLLLGVENGYS